LKILFISRSYPPIVGGLENHNHALSRGLAEQADTQILANRHGKILLPLFLPFAMIYALFVMHRRDTLVLGDGVLGIVGWAVKLFYRSQRRVVCTLHGLDVTYRLPLYQRLWLGHFIPAADQVITVSRSTRIAAIEHGLPASKMITIPNGVDCEQFVPVDIPRQRLDMFLGSSTTGKIVVYSGGRLVKRKGVAWFVEHVMPVLPDHVIYIISGKGPEMDAIRQIITRNKLDSRVLLAGQVSNAQRGMLLNSCDIFVQPNISVEGDREGFGIAVLEAAASGKPVIASAVDGLTDAISNQQNGILVEAGNADKMASIIASLADDKDTRLSLGRSARKYTCEHFNWTRISKLYANACQILPATDH
jgi:glycosyltransferase involved in cell wall biosynthesis